MAFLHKRKYHHHKIQRPPLGREFDEEGEAEEDINVDTHTDAPLRYVSLDRVYSSASLCVTASGSSNVMSKKVKARKLLVPDIDDPRLDRPPILHVYSRRPKRLRHSPPTPSFFESLILRAAELVPKLPVKTEFCGFEDSIDNNLKRKNKKSRIASSELIKLGVDSGMFEGVERPRLRDCRNHNVNSNSGTLRKKKRDSSQISNKVLSLPGSSKRWVRWVFVCFPIIEESDLIRCWDYYRVKRLQISCFDIVDLYPFPHGDVFNCCT